MITKNRKAVETKTKNAIKNNLNKLDVDPLYMLPIIKTIMDPRNPENKIIQNKILESIHESIKKDRTFMKKIKENIFSVCDSIAKDTFGYISKGIEPELQSIISKTITETINDYCKEKISTIDSIFEEYFEKLREIISKKLEEAEKKTFEMCKKAEDDIDKIKSKIDSSDCNLVVPQKYKSQMEKYLKFIQQDE